MTDLPTVYQALAQARAEFQEKGDFRKVKSEGLKFAYLPIEKAKPIIEECTSAHGVTIIPESIDLMVREPTEKKNSYGDVVVWWYMVGTVHLVILGPSGDRIEMDVLAEAKDNSDKCVNKLYTCAYKNMAKIVFGFAESPKDDSDATQEDNIKGDAPKREVPKDDPFFRTADKVKDDLKTFKEQKKSEPKKAEPKKDPEVIQNTVQNIPSKNRAIMEKALDKAISKDFAVCVKVNEWLESRGYSMAVDLSDADFEQMLIDLGVQL